MRILRVGLRLEDDGLLGQIVVAKSRFDVIAHRRDCVIGHADRVRPHVRDETDRSFRAELGQLDPLVELLREHHRLFDGKPRSLLQFARDERRRRVALALLGDDG